MRRGPALHRTTALREGVPEISAAVRLKLATSFLCLLLHAVWGPGLAQICNLSLSIHYDFSSIYICIYINVYADLCGLVYSSIYLSSHLAAFPSLYLPTCLPTYLPALSTDSLDQC